MTKPSRRWRAIFLDRDGTLIEEGGYLKNPAGVKLLPGVAAGLKRLKRAGFRLVVITNQSGVARGMMTRETVERVNRRFIRLLSRRGVKLDGLYWCAHGPWDGCVCRKPELGLLKAAAADLRVNWRGSVSVGDRFSDVALGQKTGGVGVLVLTGYGRRSLARRREAKADFVARHFSSAVNWIVKWKEGIS